MKKGFLIFISFFIFACGGENQETNKCDGVTCSGKGACVVNADGNAACNCFDGYNSNALECESDCENIDCSNHGTCKLAAGVATCDCDEGYELYGDQCLDKSNLCNGVTCSNHGQCIVENDKAACVCEDGYTTNGLLCEDKCSSIDCSGHGTCISDNEGISCECNDGYIALGTDCVPDNSELCNGISCNNHGSCVVVDNTASCNCDDNFANPENNNKACESVTTPCFRVNNEACETDVTPVPSEYFYGIYPEGTELNLLLNTPITISFTTPVDLNTVENNIYLFKDNQTFTEFTVVVDENDINKLIIKSNSDEWPIGKYSVVLLKGIKNKIGEEYKETKAYKYAKSASALIDENNNSLLMALTNKEAGKFEAFRTNSKENLENLENILSKNRSEFLISWNIEFKELFIACLYSKNVPGCENAPDYPIPSSWGMKDGHLNLVADENSSDYIKNLTMEANKADGWSVTEPFRIYMSRKPDMEMLRNGMFSISVYHYKEDNSKLYFELEYYWEDETNLLLIYPKNRNWLENTKYYIRVREIKSFNTNIKLSKNFYQSFITSSNTLVDENKNSIYSGISSDLANKLEKERLEFFSFNDLNNNDFGDMFLITFKVKTTSPVKKIRKLVEDEISNDLGVLPNPNITQTIDNISMLSDLDNLGINLETIASNLGYNSSNLYEDIAYTLIGNINLNNFLGENGVFDDTKIENNTPNIENTVFYLTIPKPLEDNVNCSEVPINGFPVIIFAHGLNRTKEDIFAIANHNAQNCYATIAIDLIKHGTRAENLVNGKGFFSADLTIIRDNIRQSVLDLVQLRKAVSKMTTLEFETNLPAGIKLDSDKISFFGMSLGGIIGTIYTTFDTHIEKVVLNTTGGSLMDILLSSEHEVFTSIIDSLPFREDSLSFKFFKDLGSIVLGESDPLSIGLYFASFTYYWDNFHGFYDGPIKNLLIQKVNNDEIIPNNATDTLKELYWWYEEDANYKEYTHTDINTSKHLFILYNSEESRRAKEDMINLFNEERSENENK